MPVAAALAVLVCVAAVGLAHLAVHSPRSDHALGAAMIVLVALPLLTISPVAAAGLLLAVVVSFRLRRNVPARVPREWTLR